MMRAQRGFVLLVLGLVSLLLGFASEGRAAVITTTFSGGNRFDGNFFNATVASNALTVSALNVNVDSGSMIIDVYDKPGTYVGFETTPAAWTLVSSTTVTGNGVNVPTHVITSPFTLPANTTTGLYVTIDTTVNTAPYMYYTNGNNTYSNADLQLTLGEGSGGFFGSLALDPARTWNGSIYYSTVTTSPPAAPVSTPEPSSLALLTLGGVALAGWRRWRKHAHR